MTLNEQQVKEIVIESSKTLARYIKMATKNGGEVSAECIADILSAGVDGWVEGRSQSKETNIEKEHRKSIEKQYESKGMTTPGQAYENASKIMGSKQSKRKKK